MLKHALSTEVDRPNRKPACFWPLACPLEVIATQWACPWRRSLLVAD